MFMELMLIIIVVSGGIASLLIALAYLRNAAVQRRYGKIIVGAFMVGASLGVVWWLGLQLHALHLSRMAQGESLTAATSLILQGEILSVDTGIYPLVPCENPSAPPVNTAVLIFNIGAPGWGNSQRVHMPWVKSTDTIDSLVTWFEERKRLRCEHAEAQTLCFSGTGTTAVKLKSLGACSAIP
jgi:hypothetical protein